MYGGSGYKRYKGEGVMPKGTGAYKEGGASNFADFWAYTYFMDGTYSNFFIYFLFLFHIRES